MQHILEIVNILYNYMVQDYIGKGGNTFLRSANCADWALGAARTAGINVPNNMTKLGITHPAKVRAWLDSKPKYLKY